MIGVVGQWCLILSKPLEKLSPYDIISFKMISEAGNILPYCEIIFNLRDKEILHKLNQGTNITVSSGVDPNTLTTGVFTVFSKKKITETPEEVTVRLLLTHSSIKYNIETVSAIYNEKSIDIIPKLVQAHGLKFETNIDTTTDKMKWVQTNTSNRVMVNKLWLHSKLPTNNDLMLTGITPDNRFLCRSLMKTKQGIGVGKWAFIPNEGCPTNGFTPVYYTQHLIHSSNIGAVDYLGGYSQTRLVHNADDGQANFMTATSAPTLAQTDKDESQGTQKRFATVSIQSKDNMHNEWYQRRDYNTRSLNKFNANTVKIIIEEQYVPCNVTDIAFVYDRTTDSGGLWLIKKVCHKVFKNRFVTIVTACRDNPNEVKQ